MNHTTLAKLAALLLFGLLTACGGGGGGDAGGSVPANAIANAGSDQNVSLKASVSLDGSASTDPDSDLLTYQWTQIAGPDVTSGIGTLTGVNPNFSAPDTVSTVRFELRVNDGHGDSAPDIVQINVMGAPITSLEVDPATQLPPNQAVRITRELLATKFANAFQLALNSPDDDITLSIEGSVEVPLPIPGVPPGVFNGGVVVALTPTIKVVKENSATYYEVTSELEKGLSFGAGVPDLPKGSEVSGQITTSASYKEVFRFNTPTDAAKGMMDVLLLKGLWQAMNELGYVGIDLKNVSDFTRTVRTYVSNLTGLDFVLNRDDAIKALNIAEELLKRAETAAEVAKSGLELATNALELAKDVRTRAQQVLIKRQRAVTVAQANYNACTWFCVDEYIRLNIAKSALNTARAALNVADDALNTAEADLSKARNLLDQATVALNQAQQAVNLAQHNLSLLPPTASIDLFEIVLKQFVDAVELLNRAHQGYEITIAKKLSGVAEADLLGSIDASRKRSLIFKYNEINRNIAVALNFESEIELQGKFPLSVVAAEMNKSNEIEYELVFEFDNKTQKYNLTDPGKFTISADLRGALSNGSDIFNIVAGAAIKPKIEFMPGRELAEFGSNLNGVIDLSPVIEIVKGFPAIHADALLQAATTTLQSFQVDRLIAAIAQQTLPLKIQFYRIAGVRSEVSAGSDEIIKGELKLSAIWNDYGNTLDLSSMTIADFVNAIFGGDGLIANADKLVKVIQDAYQETAANF